MASSPISSWQKDGETVETLFYWSPKSLKTVTAVTRLKDTCSLAGGGMTNLDSILKNRNITLPTMVHIFKAMVFPVVMRARQ